MSECSNDAEGPDGCAFDLNALHAQVAQLEAQAIVLRARIEDSEAHSNAANCAVASTDLLERHDAAIARAEAAEAERDEMRTLLKAAYIPFDVREGLTTAEAYWERSQHFIASLQDRAHRMAQRAEAAEAAIARAEKAEEEARFFAEQTNAASDRLVAVMNQRVAALARADAAEAANTRLREALERIETAWDKSWDCSADPGHKVMHDAFRALLSGETKP